MEEMDGARRFARRFPSYSVCPPERGGDVLAQCPDHEWHLASGLRQGRKAQILRPIWASLRKLCRKNHNTGQSIKGGISWRGKPGGTPRTAGTASTPAVADFWAA